MPNPPRLFRSTRLVAIIIEQYILHFAHFQSLAFQDIYHLFEKGSLILDGKELASALKQNKIHVKDEEIDQTLAIVSNQGIATY